MVKLPGDAAPQGFDFEADETRLADEEQEQQAPVAALPPVPQEPQPAKVPSPKERDEALRNELLSLGGQPIEQRPDNKILRDLDPVVQDIVWHRELEQSLEKSQSVAESKARETARIRTGTTPATENRGNLLTNLAALPSRLAGGLGGPAMDRQFDPGPETPQRPFERLVEEANRGRARQSRYGGHPWGQPDEGAVYSTPEQQKEWGAGRVTAEQERIKRMAESVRSAEADIAAWQARNPGQPVPDFYKRRLENRLAIQRKYTPEAELKAKAAKEIAEGRAPGPQLNVYEHWRRSIGQSAVGLAGSAVQSAGDLGQIVRQMAGQDVGITDSQFRKYGDAIKAYGQELFPNDPLRAEEFMTQVMYGIGSVGVFYGAGGVAAGLGRLARMTPAGRALFGTSVAAGLGGLVGGAEGVERAMQFVRKGGKVTNRDVVIAYMLTAGGGMSEALPVLSWLRTKEGGNAVASLLEQGLEEMGQEGGQQAWQNTVENILYNPDKNIMDGVFDAAAVGFVTGVAADAAKQTAQPFMPGVEQPQTLVAPPEAPQAPPEAGAPPAQPRPTPAAPTGQDAEAELPQPTTTPTEGEAKAPAPARDTAATVTSGETVAATPYTPPIGSAAPAKEVVTPDGSMRLETETVLVELDDLKYASGDLQPRDRTRAESEIGVRERAANLDPERLMPMRVSDVGAPIVAADGTIVSGNGRVMSIEQVYQDGQLAGRAQAYRDALGAQAANMRRPVLVRRIAQDVEPSELRRFADLSNRSSIAQMSATERATRDARAAGDAMQLYQGGSFEAPQNREFLRAFVESAVTPAERGSMARNGRLTQEGEQRLRNALLAASYTDADAIGRMVESRDDNVRALSGAMLDVAGLVQQLKASIARGETDPAFDITGQITEAAQRISQMRTDGVRPADALAQQDAFERMDPIVEALIRGFYNESLTRPVSRKKMTELLTLYIVEAQKHSGQEGLIPDETTPQDVVDYALAEARAAAPELFDAASAVITDLVAAGESAAGGPDAGDGRTDGRPEPASGGQAAGTQDADVNINDDRFAAKFIRNQPEPEVDQDQINFFNDLFGPQDAAPQVDTLPTDAMRAAFSQVLAGKAPRSRWGLEVDALIEGDITEDQLRALEAEALDQGLLQERKNGRIARTQAAKTQALRPRGPVTETAPALEVQPEADARGQTSLIPATTTQEQIAAEANRRRGPAAEQQAAGGLFSDAVNQTDLADFVAPETTETSRPSADDYVKQGLANLAKTSRTVAGILDVSASKEKADQMADVSADEAARKAVENYERVIRKLYADIEADALPTDAATMADYLDNVATEINGGIIKEGELYRKGNSEKYPYTDVAKIDEARLSFAQAFIDRLNDPAADPVETAAYAEWRVNLTDHIYADGVGKTSKAIASIPLMQAGLTLPNYRDNKEFFANGNSIRRNPDEGEASYLDYQWHNFRRYYQGLMPDDLIRDPLALREKRARQRMGEDDWVFATIPDDSRDTQKLPGYGTPEFWAERRYNTPGGEVVGYENGIAYLREQARVKVREQGGEVKSEKKMFMLLGKPGAGKSTIARKIMERHGALHLVGDDAKLIIPEYDGGNNSGGVHEEASDMMKDVLGRERAEGVNVINEKLGSSDASVEKIIADYKQDGYKVIVVQVEVPKALAMERAIKRYEEEGRAVPLSEFDKTALNMPRLVTKLGMEEKADETAVIRFDEVSDRFEDARSELEIKGLWPRAGTGVGYSRVGGLDRDPGDPRGRGAGPSQQEEVAVEAREIPGFVTSDLTDNDFARERAELAIEAWEEANGEMADNAFLEDVLRVETTRGDPDATQNLVDELYSSPGFLKPDAIRLANAVGYPTNSRTSKREALNSIVQRTRDMIANREVAELIVEGEDVLREDAGDLFGSAAPGDVRQPTEVGQAGSALPGDRAGGDRAEGRDRGPTADGAAQGGPAGTETVSGEAGRVRGDTAEGQRDRIDRDRVRALVAEKEAERRERRQSNYQITPEDGVGQGTEKQKVRANLDAIRTLRTLEQENRPATREEQQALARYTGWGAFAQAMFDDRSESNAKKWAKERAELKDLVSPDEYAAARESTLNAHFTSPEVVDGMWEALRHLGFNGGRVLEPAAGSGNFIGMMPADLAAETDWSAVELDQLTGGIASKLYPGADVRVAGFETQNWPDNFFDASISNVPFGNYKLRDTTNKDYKGLLIHDYFIVKGLDKVRPGGLVAYITSAGTMDKGDDRARKLMAKRADLVGAIRLPGGNQGAFAANAGTDVTTDILIFQKRGPGQQPADTSWTETVEHNTPEGPTRINRYFAENPKMMLGKMRLMGTMYRKDSPVLIGPTDKMGERILKAVRDNLPENVFVRAGEVLVDPIADDVDTDAAAVKEGAYYEKDGKLYRRVSGVGQPVQTTKANALKIQAFIPVRDVYNKLLGDQARGIKDTGDALRAELNKVYDAFVKKFGPINKTTVTVTKRLDSRGNQIVVRKRPNLDPLKDDPDAYKVAALEAYNEETGKAAKAAVFDEDVLIDYQRPAVQSEADALAISLNERGKVDIPFLAETLEMSEEEVVAALGDMVFLNPSTREYETTAVYLSGDVVGKLEDARRAAETDPQFVRHVEALENVQPPPLTRVDIRVLMGAPWVDATYYNQFLEQEVGGRNVEVVWLPASKKWKVESGYFAADVRNKWGHGRADFEKIIEAALNNTSIKVTDKVRDADGGTTEITNQAATEEVQARIDALRNAFSGAPELGIDGWVWADEQRAQELEGIYNNRFNRLVARTYDGSHLTFPGMARVLSFPDGSKGEIRLPEYRTGVIWRIISEGNTLMAHGVGSGKTFTSIMSGMEQKRLGLIQRPAYVVPNHMLEQFTTEFLQIYPGAKLLVADEKSMKEENRREFAARAAAERWDGVIITHDAFGRIKMSDDYVQKFMEQEVEAMREMEAQAKAEGDGRDRTVKDIERKRKALQDRLAKLANVERKDRGMTFEEMGIDFLYVDEAHLFKNLNFNTKQGGIKGLSQNPSQRAYDLFMKIQYLEQSRPGRSAVFMTGTPVSNSIAELYTMMRYLQLPTMKEYGIDEFDAWLQSFAEVTSQPEIAPNGRDIRETRSISKFVNLPELMNIYGMVADVQTPAMLNLPTPELEGGAPIVVEAELSDAEEAVMTDIVRRSEEVKGKRPEKGEDNILSVMNDGLKLATDIRLLQPDQPMNPDNKVGKAIDNIVKEYEAGGEAPALAQIVFLDMGVPKSKSKGKKKGADDDAELDTEEAEFFQDKFDLYNDIKARLIERGIPKDEIAFIHDANNDIKKARLFKQVKEGRVRVLLGTTGKMGVGTNVQKNLVAMHHIDAPWRPADLEQRDGRIMRQGNANETVRIYRYITTRSLDAVRWQQLERKAGFIAQLAAGARGLREAEDIDSPLPEASQIKAAATGDPRIMEHAELTKEVRVVEAQKRTAERQVIAARKQVEEMTARQTKIAESIEVFAADAAKVTDVSGENFVMSVDVGRSGPVEMKERKKAGEAIKGYLAAYIERGGGYGRQRLPVGTMSGFSVEVEVERRVMQGQIIVEAIPVLKGEQAYFGERSFVIDEDLNPVSLVQRFEYILNKIPKSLEDRQATLAQLEDQIPKMIEQSQFKAFPREQELRDMKARLHELELALDPEKRAKAEAAGTAQAAVAQADVGESPVDRMLRKSLEAGKTIPVPAAVQSSVENAMADTLEYVPAGHDVGIMTKIIPMGQTDEGMLVSVAFKDPRNGSEFFVPYRWDDLVSIRAVRLPGGRSSTGRPAILTAARSLRGQSAEGLRAVVWHELVHAYRSLGLIASFDSLASHANLLGVMDMTFAELRDAGIVLEGPADTTLRKAYEIAYANEPDSVIDELINQEAVAHMVELDDLGHFTTEQMAPVRESIDAFKRGEVTPESQEGITSIEDIPPTIDAPHPGPVLAYHATPRAFEKFDPSKSMDIGIHFGSRGQAAGLMSDRLNSLAALAEDLENGWRTFPVVLDIKNPVTLPDLGYWEPQMVLNALERQGVDFTRAETDAILFAEPEQERDVWEIIQRRINAAGYDGVRYLNSFEGDLTQTKDRRGMGTSGWSYIVWNRGAVRSAITDRELLAIRAYHFSASRFERFDPGFIGSGDGGQRLGDGFYFARNQDGAITYQNEYIDEQEPPELIGGRIPADGNEAAFVRIANYKIGRGIALTNDHVAFVADDLAESRRRGLESENRPFDTPEKLEKRIAELEAQIATESDLGRAMIENDIRRARRRMEELRAFVPRTDAEIDALVEQERQSMLDVGRQLVGQTIERAEPKPGFIYSVSLDVEDDQLFDFKKRVSEQPESVRQALTDNPAMRQAIEALGDPIGADLFKSIRYRDDVPSFTDLGIPGATEYGTVLIYNADLIRIETVNGEPVAQEERDMVLASMRRGPQPETPRTARPGDPVSERFAQAAPEYVNSLLDYVRKITPDDVAIRLQDNIEYFGTELGAKYSPTKRLLTLSMQMTPDEAFATARHEAVHVARMMGLFTPQEWQILTERAVKIDPERDNAGLQNYYETIYREHGARRGLTGADLDAFVAEYIDQERVARMAEEWQGGARYGRGIDGFFQRIRDFIGALANAARGLGFQTSADIFNRLETGEIAARRREGPAAQAAYAAFGLADDVTTRVRSWEQGTVETRESEDGRPVRTYKTEAGAAASIMANDTGSWAVQMVNAPNERAAADLLADIETDLGQYLAPNGWLTTEQYERWVNLEPENVRGHQQTGPLFNGLWVAPDQIEQAIDVTAGLVGRGDTPQLRAKAGRMASELRSLRGRMAPSVLPAVQRGQPGGQYDIGARGMGSDATDALTRPGQRSIRRLGRREDVSIQLSDLVKEFNRMITAGAETVGGRANMQRQGRMNPAMRRRAAAQGGWLAGLYDRATGVTRMAIPLDFVNLSHEGGHALETRADTRDAIAALKTRHAHDLLVPPAPDYTPQAFAPSGFSGLELDAEAQAALARAYEIEVQLRGRGVHPRQQSILQREADTQMAIVERSAGKTPTSMAIDDLFRRGVPAAQAAADIATRFSASGQPQPRVIPSFDADQISEAWSNWFQYYVTAPDEARKQAPALFAEFADEIDGIAPEILSTLEDIQDQYQQLVNASPVQALRSRLGTSLKPGVWGTLRQRQAERGFFGGIGASISDWAYYLYRDYVDNKHPLKVAVKYLIDAAVANNRIQLNGRERVILKAIQDPYKRVRLAEHVMTHATAVLQTGVRLRGMTVGTGPSYHDALTTAFGGSSASKWSQENIEKFGSYLIARRLEAEWVRYENGDLPNPPDQLISRQAINKARADLEAENPQFVKAAAQLYRFQQDVLEWQYQEGFISEDAYNDYSSRTDYAPLNRIMDQAGAASALKSATGRNKAKMIHRFLGSTRDFINPLESIAQNVYQVQSRVELNGVIRTLDRLARAAGPGGGAIAERIPANDMRASKVDLREVLKLAAKQAGLQVSGPMQDQGFADLMAEIDAMFDEDAAAEIFKATETNERGEQIMYLWEDGKKIPILIGETEIARDVFRMFENLGKDNSDFIMQAGVLGAQALRAGVTKAPAYIIVNFLRDQLATWILSDNYTPFVTGAKGLVGTVAGGEAADRYNYFAGLMGGIDSSLMSTSTQKREIAALRKKGFWAVPGGTVIGRTWNGFLRTMEVTEAATRVGHMDAAYKRALADGMTPEEAAFEAAYSAHDVMDFSRRGRLMSGLARLVPFLNAAIQGLDAGRRTWIGQRNSSKRKTDAQGNAETYRDMATPYLKAIDGQPLSVAEREMLPLSAKAVVKMMMLGAVGFALAAFYDDDEEYEEFSDYMRATHWFFKVGDTWYRFPKPFELAFFSNLFEAAYAGFKKDDPRAAIQFRDSLYHTLIPPHEIQAMKLYYELQTGKNLFTGRDIVPMGLEGKSPREQYTSYTSELAKLIGGTFNLSPVMVDHALGGGFATVGRDIGALSNIVLPEIQQLTGGALPGVRMSPRAEQSFEDRLILSRLTRRSSRGALSTQQFSDLMSRAGGKFVAAANDYEDAYNAGLVEGEVGARARRQAKSILDGLDDNRKAYALLQVNDFFDADDRRLHPLKRAKDISNTAYGILREMNQTGIVRKESEADETRALIHLSPSDQRKVNEILSDVAMREKRNALIITGVDGWKQKNLMPVDGLLEELKAVAPDVHAEYDARQRNKSGKLKILKFEDVRRLWPEAQKRILKEGREADLGDLLADADFY